MSMFAKIVIVDETQLKQKSEIATEGKNGPCK